MKKIFFGAFMVMVCTINVQAQEFLTLEQCLEMAKSHNHTLRNAALDIQAATEQQKEAYTDYYPKISANVLAFHTFDKLIKGDGTYPEEIAMLGDQFAELVGQPYSFKELNKGYSAAISVNQPIYAGGRITAGNKLTQVQKDIMVLQQELKEKDVLQKVVECYWQIAIVKYNIATIDAADTQVKSVYKDTELRVKAGIVTGNATIKIKLRQQELASNRLTLENTEHILRMLLAQQIGMGSKDIDIKDYEKSIINPESLHISSIDAVNTRQEFAMANKGIDAQKLQIKMERGKNLPTVAVGLMGFNSGIGGLSEKIKNGTNSTFTNGLVMGTVSIPISSWWGGSHAIKRQKIKLEQLNNDMIETKEKLLIDIESAWSNLIEAYKQISIANVSVDEAEENLRISTDRYHVGTETISDLLDAEMLNRQSHNQLSQALAKYNICLNDYQRKTR